MDLHILWFVLLGVLLVGYAILDGFDLGVGILLPFIRGDHPRRLALNSIGPLWDGNEVWLVTFGGALFAAFPDAYAAVLSGLYLPVMVVLLSLIGRAISIEFRSKRSSRAWRLWWDGSFFLSSFTATLVFGVALGNIVQGVALGADGSIAMPLLDAFRPFPLAVGTVAVLGAAMHGGAYLQLKTEGKLFAVARRRTGQSIVLFGLAYVVLTVLALQLVPQATVNLQRWPWLWSVPALQGAAVTALAYFGVVNANRNDEGAMAFVCSSATIASSVALAAVALFPNLVVSLDPAVGPHLDIYNASSSSNTLTLMTVIAAIGMPLVLTYTSIVMWVFRGKVKLDAHSY